MTYLPLIAAATLLSKVKTSFLLKEGDIAGDKPKSLDVSKEAYTLVDTDANVYGEVSRSDVDKLLGIDEDFLQAEGHVPLYDCQATTIWLDKDTSATVVVNKANVDSLMNKCNRFAVSAKDIDTLKVIPLCMISYAEYDMALALNNLLGGFDHDRAAFGLKFWKTTPSSSFKPTLSPTKIALVDKETTRSISYQLMPVMAAEGKPIQFVVIQNERVDEGVLFADIYDAMDFVSEIWENLPSKPAKKSKVARKNIVPSLPLDENAKEKAFTKSGDTETAFDADYDDDDDD